MGGQVMDEKFLLAVKERLRQKGFRLTGPRLAILNYLVREKGHPAMQEILEGIFLEHTGIGLATVYRTVDLFLEIGVLRVLTLRNNHLRYELNWPNNHHHHLVCYSCGQVTEFGSCNFQLIAREIEKVTRFKIDDHTLEAYGLCPQCSKGESYSYSTEKI